MIKKIRAWRNRRAFRKVRRSLLAFRRSTFKYSHLVERELELIQVLAHIVEKKEMNGAESVQSINFYISEVEHMYGIKLDKLMESE